MSFPLRVASLDSEFRIQGCWYCFCDSKVNRMRFLTRVIQFAACGVVGAAVCGRALSADKVAGGGVDRYV